MHAQRQHENGVVAVGKGTARARLSQAACCAPRCTTRPRKGRTGYRLSGHLILRDPSESGGSDTYASFDPVRTPPEYPQDTRSISGQNYHCLSRRPWVYQSSQHPVVWMQTTARSGHRQRRRRELRLYYLNTNKNLLCTRTQVHKIQCTYAYSFATIAAQIHAQETEKVPYKVVQIPAREEKRLCM